jgi:hypothetical protein
LGLSVAGLLAADLGVGSAWRQTPTLELQAVSQGTGEGAPWPVEDRLFAHDQVDNWGFGNAVALDGDRAIVGAWRADIGGEADRGAAYVFVRQGAEWVEEAQLLAFDGAEGDRFGYSVALSGDTAVVGAPLVTVGNATFRGAAYVFQIIGGGWLPREKLLASDGAAQDRLGWSVAIQGDTLFAGAVNAEIGGNPNQGAVYVYTRQGGLWSESQKLFDEEGALADLFGNALSLSENTALVGAYSANIDGNINQGATHVYSRVGETWVLDQKLLASDGTDPDKFGWSVALHGDAALIGAWQKVIDGNAAHGAAYVFRRSGTTWTEEQRLTPSDGHEFTFFGWAVALQDHVALIGARHDFPGASQQGVVYEFRRSTTWDEVQRLEAPVSEGLDGYGEALALDSRRALIASRTNDVVFPLGGTVWVHGRPVLFEDGFESGDTAAWSVVAQ